MRYKKLIFLVGPPASGKDTQGKLLTKKLKLKFCVTSQLLRDFFHKNRKKYLTIKGKLYDLNKEKEKMEKGVLVSSELVLYVILNKIRELTSQKNFHGLVFAGSPRTLREAKVEYQFLKNNFPNDFVFVFLDVSQKEIFKRSLKRGRKDDVTEIVKKRIVAYKKDTLPAINFLKKLGVLVKINGEGGVKEIHQRIIKKIMVK